MVDENLRVEGGSNLLGERARHGSARVGDRTDGRGVEVAETRVVDEVVEERRREVERRDLLLLDQLQCPVRVPLGLRDEAAADERDRDQRMDAHRVVQRHHAEGALTESQAVLDELGEPTGALGSVRPGDALRPPGCPRRVELDRGRALLEVVGCRWLGTVQCSYLGRIANHHPSAAIGDAVVEVGVRDPLGEWYEACAEPLRAPVELDRLGFVA